MRHEIPVDGPLRELYPDGAPSDPDGHWVIEIGWPIFRSDRAI